MMNATAETTAAVTDTVLVTACHWWVSGTCVASQAAVEHRSGRRESAIVPTAKTPSASQPTVVRKRRGVIVSPSTAATVSTIPVSRSPLR
ncbi:hypothetical protein RE943_00570 [Prescottella equi]|nr:hypothetical protein RE943_00570 [Prescottella equi]